MRTLSSTFLVLLVVALSGCGRNQGKKQETKAGGTQGASDEIKVAFVTNNPASFWTIAERGTEKAAQDFKVEVIFRRPPAPGTAAEQQRILEDLLDKGVQGVAISPNDAKNAMGFLKRSVASKVPMICQDSDVPDPKARRCYLGTHNYRAGRAAGALVEKAIPEGGKFAIFVGKMDVQNAVERRQGVLDYLSGKDQKEMGELTPADATNLKVGNHTLVDTKTDNVQANVCQQRAEDLLSREGDIACLVGLWEYNPPALLKASQAAKLDKKPAIVGFDEHYQTLEAIRAGDIIGTVVQDPFNFGYESIKILSHMARDGDDRILKSYKDIDDKNRIVIPHRVITREVTKMPEGITTLQVDSFFADLKKLKGDS